MVNFYVYFNSIFKKQPEKNRSKGNTTCKTVIIQITLCKHSMRRRKPLGEYVEERIMSFEEEGEKGFF